MPAKRSRQVVSESSESSSEDESQLQGFDGLSSEDEGDDDDVDELSRPTPAAMPPRSIGSRPKRPRTTTQSTTVHQSTSVNTNISATQSRARGGSQVVVSTRGSSQATRTTRGASQVARSSRGGSQAARTTRGASQAARSTRGGESGSSYTPSIETDSVTNSSGAIPTARRLQHQSSSNNAPASLHSYRAPSPSSSVSGSQETYSNIEPDAQDHSRPNDLPRAPHLPNINVPITQQHRYSQSASNALPPNPASRSERWFFGNKCRGCVCALFYGVSDKDPMCICKCPFTMHNEAYMGTQEEVQRREALRDMNSTVFVRGVNLDVPGTLGPGVSIGPLDSRRILSGTQTQGGESPPRPITLRQATARGRTAGTRRQTPQIIATDQDDELDSEAEEVPRGKTQRSRKANTEPEEVTFFIVPRRFSDIESCFVLQHRSRETLRLMSRGLCQIPVKLKRKYSEKRIKDRIDTKVEMLPKPFNQGWRFLEVEGRALHEVPSTLKLNFKGMLLKICNML